MIKTDTVLVQPFTMLNTHKHHTHTHPHTHSHTHPPTHTLTHTPTHPPTHSLTHTHTHTPPTTMPILYFCVLDRSSIVSSITMFMYGSNPLRTPVTVRPPFSLTAHTHVHAEETYDIMHLLRASCLTWEIKEFRCYEAKIESRT